LKCAQEDVSNIKLKNMAKQFIGPEVIEYKRIKDVRLNLHLFRPNSDHQKCACIVWFFCGAWKGFDAQKLYAHAEYFSTRGIANVAVEVRVNPRHGTSPVECFIDARSAMRWMRKNASQLGIDSSRIVTAGSSAAGHISVCLSLIEKFDDPNDDVSISSRPNAVVMFCPALGVLTTPEFTAKFPSLELARELSPLEFIRSGLPPMLVIHTRDDEACLVEHSIAFEQRMKATGNHCDLVLWDKGGHGFFNYYDGKNPLFIESMRATDQFLASLGWIEGTPTIDDFHDTQGLTKEWLKKREEGA
jgi:acetyl esterase